MKKKKQKMKLLMLLGVILVASVIAFIVVKSVNSDKNIYDKWEYVYNEELEKVELKNYEPQNYVTDVFNTINSSLENQYTYVYPEDMRLNRMAFGTFSLSGSGIDLTFHTVTIEEFKDFEKEIYEGHKIQYKTASMEKKKVLINKVESMVYLSKCSDGKTYIEELIILVPEGDNTYLELIYTIHQNSFTDKFINTVVSGFEINEGKAKKESCELIEDNYSCKINFSNYYGVNRQFEFNVDGNKYIYEGDVSHYVNDKLKFVKTYENDEDVDINWENVNINIVYNRKLNILKFLNTYDNDYDVKYNDYVNINGKKLFKVEYEVEEGYSNEVYYVDQLTDHLAIVIYVVSLDNTDDVVKNFLDYKIKNPVNEY